MTRAAYGGVPRQEKQRAVQAAAEHHLPLVAAALRRFPHQGYEREELYQQGCLGLMKALARFDPERGTAFSTYAVTMIMGEMRMLSRQSAPVHIPRTDREQRQRVRRVCGILRQQLGREPTIDEAAQAMRMEAAELAFLMESVQVTSTDAPGSDGRMLLDRLADADAWETRLELRDLLSRLPERDMKLLLLRYRMGLSQRETGDRLGMTQTQVSRREGRLLRSLREEWQREV